MAESNDMNPWCDAYVGLTDRDHLRKLLTVPGVPLVGLAQAQNYQIADLVATGLRKIRIYSDNAIDIAWDVMQRVVGHYSRGYPSRQKFLENVYDQDAHDMDRDYKPVCLTGHSGVGKSTLMLDVHRILRKKMHIDVGSGHDKVKLTGCWRVTLSKGLSINQVLKKLIDAENSYSTRRRTAELLERARETAYRDGVGLIVVDEIQFLAQSTNARTAISSLLLELGKLGIPLVYVANFSACHKIQDTPEEVRDRLLSAPQILLPCLRDTEHWRRYMSEVQRVLGNTLGVSLVDEQSTIFSLTAGLMRHVEHLLVGAYSHVWSQGRRQVTLGDLMNFYDSTGNSEYRRQVERAVATFANRNSASKQDQCPFPMPTIVAEVYANLEKDERAKTYANEVVLQSLPINERKAYEAKQKRQRAKDSAQPKRAEKSLRPKSMTPAENYAEYRANGGRGLYPPRR